MQGQANKGNSILYRLNIEVHELQEKKKIIFNWQFFNLSQNLRRNYASIYELQIT